ncbi:MAG: type II secretion system protein [Planctomycetes bacterium]|nr:type II secretion system protein [Planctomycetota bacterium]MCB9887279.1 type II secretion system protein [Planctomycetota bacterium]
MVDLRDDLGGVRRLDRERGFTLVEMLAALGILLFGITALLGALSQSVSQRRSTDARLAAAALADEIVHRLQHEALRLRPDAESDLDVEFATLADQEAPNFPGMTWSVTTTRDDDRPDLWLADIKVTWLEEGEDTSEEFLRVLPRQLPLAQRVLRFRAETTSR